MLNILIVGFESRESAHIRREVEKILDEMINNKEKSKTCQDEEIEKGEISTTIFGQEIARTFSWKHKKAAPFVIVLCDSHNYAYNVAKKINNKLKTAVIAQEIGAYFPAK